MKYLFMDKNNQASRKRPHIADNQPTTSKRQKLTLKVGLETKLLGKCKSTFICSS